MKHHLIRAAILASLLVAAPSHAEESARVYLQKIDGPDRTVSNLYKATLHSYGIGFIWANAALQSDGRTALSCVPPELKITAEQHVSMLRFYVEGDPSVANSNAGLVLLLAHRVVFPCKTTAR